MNHPLIRWNHTIDTFYTSYMKLKKSAANRHRHGTNHAKLKNCFPVTGIFPPRPDLLLV